MAKVDSIPGLGVLKDFIKDPIKDFLLTLGKKSGTPPVEEFSPSLKAAEALKQEKGPYEQLKATMINKHGAKEAEMDWSGANDLFAGKTVTKTELVDYLSGRSRGFDAMRLQYNDPTDLIKRSTSVAKGFMIDPYLPNLTRVMRGPRGYFVAEQGSDKPIQGNVFYDSSEKAYEVSDRINDKRLQMSGMKESGLKIVSPDELTYTQDNFPLGGTDTAETVYRFDDPTGIYDDAVASHHKFNLLPDDNVLAHTRTAQFPVVDGGTGYHVGEIQSDVFQHQRWATKLGRAPREKLRSRSEELAYRDELEGLDMRELTEDINIFNRAVKIQEKEFINKINEKLNAMGADSIDYRGFNVALDRGYVVPQVTKSNPNFVAFSEIGFDDSMFRPLNVYDNFKDEFNDLMKIKEKFQSAKDEFADVSNLQVLKKTNIFKQLPYGESTNQWVDMVLRKELAKAIDSGSEFMTIPSSDLVRKYTSGSEEGQGKFYDQIVPMRLNKLAKRYDPNISVIPRQIKTQAGVENVTALPLTQKLIDNIMKKGLPKYAVPITGGSLGALSFVEGEQQ
jgi:hypothetical protein